MLLKWLFQKLCHLHRKIDAAIAIYDQLPVSYSFPHDDTEMNQMTFVLMAAL